MRDSIIGMQMRATNTAQPSICLAVRLSNYLDGHSADYEVF